MSTATLPEISPVAAKMVESLDEVAALPEVTSRIMATIEDEDSTAVELNDVISHDPALVSRIMKMVNSAFFARPNPIASVERAIVLLGFEAIQRLAVAASLGAMFKGAKLCAEFSAKDLWKHCIGVGVVARELAMGLKLPLVEEAFLAGIMHDIGIVAALQAKPEELKAACDKAKKDPRPFCDIERETMGVTHQELGAALAAKWNFATGCRHAAEFHHEPEKSPEESRLLVCLVHVADTLCCKERFAFDRTALHQTMNEKVVRAAGIRESVIEATREKLSATVYSAVTVFG